MPSIGYCHLKFQGLLWILESRPLLFLIGRLLVLVACLKEVQSLLRGGPKTWREVPPQPHVLAAKHGHDWIFSTSYPSGATNLGRWASRSMLINGVTFDIIASSAQWVNDRGMSWVMRPSIATQLIQSTFEASNTLSTWAIGFRYSTLGIMTFNCLDIGSSDYDWFKLDFLSMHWRIWPLKYKHHYHNWFCCPLQAPRIALSELYQKRGASHSSPVFRKWYLGVSGLRASLDEFVMARVGSIWSWAYQYPTMN